jgi:5-methyltetrahydrofolate--homocysteine methyltransferase
VDAVGSNCGTGPDTMVEIVRALHEAAPDLPVLAMPNAGVPVLRDGVTVFEATPRDVAGHVSGLVAAGARIIGGCCGTTPDHVRAMRAAVDAIGTT